MTTATETLTIRLSAAAAHRLRRIAEIVHRPVDEIIAETLLLKWRGERIPTLAESANP